MGLDAEGNSQGVMVVAVSAIFEAFAITAVALRMWSRRLKKASLAANDYAILLALVRQSAKCRQCF
jgi:hypothetical protein